MTLNTLLILPGRFLSQVTITLLGTEGESDPHHLTDPDKPVFERGGVDMFLLTTHFSLGDLQSIRLWHDNSGERPAWYGSEGESLHHYHEHSD